MNVGSVRKLGNDQRGAIMVIGLFVALSLVAALWFLFGVGEAIVFRDRGQEAADAAVLSAATVHARGMNVISAINLISLALAMFYLILCLIGDALMLIAAALAAASLVTFGGTAGMALKVAEAGLKVYQGATSYERTVLKTALPVLGGASTAVAFISPWLGSAAGLEAAGHYKDANGTFVGITLGPSHIPMDKSAGADPGGEGKSSSGKEEKSSSGKKSKGSALTKGEHQVLGLPVSEEDNQTLCIRAINYPVKLLLEKVLGWIENIPAIGWVAAKAAKKALVPMIDNLTLVPAFLHCGGGLDKIKDPKLQNAGKKIDEAMDKVREKMSKLKIPAGTELWDEKGPKKMAYANGDAHLLVLGWSLGDRGTDDSVQKVKLGQHQFGGGESMGDPFIYDAQAEFFYDCGQNWTHISCNGPSSIGLLAVGNEHAIYSIRWKARLKRTMPVAEVIARVGVEKALDYFTSKPYRDKFNKQNDPAKDAKLRKHADKLKTKVREWGQKVGLDTESYH